MKSVSAIITSFAVIASITLCGCEKQQSQKPGGQIPPVPDSSPTTTSPMNPGTK